MTWLSLALAGCAGNPVEAEIDPSPGTDGTSATTSTTTGSDAISSGSTGQDATSGGTLGSSTDDSSGSEADADEDSGEPATGSSGEPAGSCGDGMVDPGEGCDDANADELDGCTSACAIGPTALQWGGLASTGIFGGTHPTITFDGFEDCPVGEVLVGFTGGLVPSDGWLGTVQGHCQTMSLTNTDPPALELAPGTELGTHGEFGSGGPWTLLCPPGEVVVRARGRAGSVLDQLELRCATPSLELDADRQVQIVIATGTLVGPAGSNGGDVVGPVTCPSGQLAGGAHLRTNSYFVSLALRCRDVAVVYPGA